MNVKFRTGNCTKSLWTLLEAVVANPDSLAIAFSDGMLTFKELEIAKRLAQDNLFNEYHHICHAGHPFSHAVYQLQKIERNPDIPKYRAQRVWNTAQFQHLDKGEDEAPILGAIMKIDVTQFANGELTRRDMITQGRDDKERVHARRMVKLLELMNEAPGLGVPSGLVFLPLPRLRRDDFPETKHYGWAPKSWLTRRAHPRPLRLPLRTIARTHTNGLLVRYPGLAACSSAPLTICEQRFWVPVAQSMHKWYKVSLYPLQTNLELWWKAHMSTRMELLIILSEANPREKGAIGLLVASKGLLSDGQIRWVDSLCQVWVRLEGDRKIIKRECEKFRRESPLIGTRIAEQEWCVDGVPASEKIWQITGLDRGSDDQCGN